METGSPGKRPVLPKRARLLVTAGMGMLALLLFGPRLVDIYVDWLWFGEVGFRSVWITVLLTRLAIVAAVALVVAGIVLAALLLAYRSRPFFVPDEPQRDPVAPLRSAVMRRPRLFGWGIAVTLGVVCGLIASFDWVKVQLFVHGGTFGIVDPEFGYDIGFFRLRSAVLPVGAELAVRGRGSGVSSEPVDALPVRRPSADNRQRHADPGSSRSTRSVRRRGCTAEGGCLLVGSL